jgi:hypothetical protein
MKVDDFMDQRLIKAMERSSILGDETLRPTGDHVNSPSENGGEVMWRAVLTTMLQERTAPSFKINSESLPILKLGAVCSKMTSQSIRNGRAEHLHSSSKSQGEKTKNAGPQDKGG